jgi:uncharacterized protein YbjT (DUF2867 family)
VEEMDLAEFYAVYREDGHGRAAHESLARAIAGIEKVFLLCGPTAQEVQLNRNAIDAARESGSSSWCEARILGSDPSSPATFVRDHGACDRLVEVTYRP